MKNVLKISWIFSLVIGTLFFMSCDKDNGFIDNDLFDLSDTENYTDQAVYEVESRTNSGRSGCFELVFPISLDFPDETTEEVNDLDELKTTIRAWKEANPDATERPTLVYPIEVISEDGELISVADKAGLKELKEGCGGFRGNGPRGHGGKCKDLCFEINYPLTIELPDGTTAEGNSRRELKQAARDWKAANPDATERPMLAFPIEVTLEGGTVQSVASKEDLKALKESCE